MSRPIQPSPRRRKKMRRVPAARLRLEQLEERQLLDAALAVTSFTSTNSGFVAEFSAPLEAASLSLYDAQMPGASADVVLTGASSGPVAGSLVVDPSLASVSFVKTGGLLAPDDYTVTVRSSASGVIAAAGEMLDGDSNGAVGDDFVASFTVAPAAAGTVTIGVADFVRGPGQSVHVPADGLTGIPLTISEGSGVHEIQARLRFDPALLQINSATLGAEMPPEATLSLTHDEPGLVTLEISSTVPLPSGHSTLVNVHAIVPTADAIYRRQEVLDVHDVIVRDAADNEFPVVDDDGVHLATYLSDISGNWRTNAIDASLVARFAAAGATGFSATPLSDPQLVADVSGNGRVNAFDATLIAQYVAGLEVRLIPAIPQISAGSSITTNDSVQPVAVTPLVLDDDSDERAAAEPAEAFSVDQPFLSASNEQSIDHLMADLAAPRADDPNDLLAAVALEATLQSTLCGALE